MIEVKGIHSYYGKSHILHGVSLELKQGELVCLLGRNGVGKSTTLKSIMGIVRPTQGSIRFDGKELVGSQPYQIARLGVGYVPEDRRRHGVIQEFPVAANTSDITDAKSQELIGNFNTLTEKDGIAFYPDWPTATFYDELNAGLQELINGTKSPAEVNEQLGGQYQSGVDDIVG